MCDIALTRPCSPPPASLGHYEVGLILFRSDSGRVWVVKLTSGTGCSSPRSGLAHRSLSSAKFPCVTHLAPPVIGLPKTSVDVDEIFFEDELDWPCPSTGLPAWAVVTLGSAPIEPVGTVDGQLIKSEANLLL